MDYKNFHEIELVSLYIQNSEILEDIQSKYHHIVLLNHKMLGKVLIIDNEIHHIEKYNFYYHEMMVHLPMAFLPNCNSVLILGGGSLFAAKECLKYPYIKDVFLCDHDEAVIQTIKKYYQHSNTVCDDKRFHIIYEDAIKFLSQSKTYFDIIINDCFNLIELNNHINVYELLKNHLTQSGICADVIYKHIYCKETNTKTIELINRQFQYHIFSLISVPEYPGFLFLLTIFGKNVNLTQEASHNLNLFQLENEHLFEYYCPRFIGYYTYLPRFIKKLFNKIDGKTNISTR